MTIQEHAIEVFQKYQLNVINFYEIGYECDVSSAGRVEPLTQSELKEIVKELDIPFICVTLQDVQFSWRLMYNSVVDVNATVTAEPGEVGPSMITVEPDELEPVVENEAEAEAEVEVEVEREEDTTDEDS